MIWGFVTPWVHKLCGIYWTLGNLPPGSHSLLSSIFLAVLCKTDDLNKYGYDRVLSPLLHDMKTLEQEGVFIPILGRCLKGTVQAVVADNLGAHCISGFNESSQVVMAVGFAQQQGQTSKQKRSNQVHLLSGQKNSTTFM